MVSQQDPQDQSGRPDRLRRYAPWAVPIVVAGVIVAGAAALSGGASGATPSLAARTPAQLLSAVRTSASTAFSGEISETANLGLPSLPGDSSTASLSWQTFVTGTHRARVWVAGADKQRAALIGELSEADVVHNGKDLWTYTSDTNTVSHTVLSKSGSGRAGASQREATPSEVPLTPAQQTSKILAAINPSTSVTLGKNVTVAKHAAYTLVIAPRDASSTVRQITIAIDSAHYIPLRVQVFGASSAAALEVGFSDITFATPAASIFDFHVPAGATVTTNPLTASRHGQHDGARGTAPDAGPSSGSRSGSSAAGPATRVIGSGWTSVLELRHGLGSLAGGMSRELDQLTTPVGSGARLLHTALVNAVITSDGRAFVGAVTPAALEHIAATTTG